MFTVNMQRYSVVARDVHCGYAVVFSSSRVVHCKYEVVVSGSQGCALWIYSDTQWWAVLCSKYAVVFSGSQGCALSICSGIQ
jgi:hypothetical protein